MLVPSILHQFINHPNIHNADLSSLELVGSGAAYLPTDLTKKVASITRPGIDIVQGVPSSSSSFRQLTINPTGYGMSECVHIFSLHSPSLH
jgi:acyl-CoA synthetase (AMP-forming)/AMP-acid ligase II